MNINNDLLTRSLAQLAGDPATDTEAALKSSQFAAALRRLDTDPSEAARIDAIASEVDRPDGPIDLAMLCEADFQIQEVSTDSATGDTTYRVVIGNAKANRPGGERPGRATKRTRWFATSAHGITSAVIAVLAICASIVAIFAASSLATTSIVASGLTVATMLPVLVRSAILWICTRDLVCRDRSDMVLRIMMKDESPAVTRNTTQRR